MYHVYMRNLGDIFEKIPISVSTLYKVSCLFNPTTESSPSFCFFWTPGSSTALVKEFQGFSIRRQPASRIAPKNHGNPCSPITYLTSVSSVECLCKGATSLCPSWPSCRQIEAPMYTAYSCDISPRLWGLVAKRVRFGGYVFAAAAWRSSQSFGVRPKIAKKARFVLPARVLLPTARCGVTKASPASCERGEGQRAQHRRRTHMTWSS